MDLQKSLTSSTQTIKITQRGIRVSGSFQFRVTKKPWVQGHGIDNATCVCVCVLHTFTTAGKQNPVCFFFFFCHYRRGRPILIHISGYTWATTINHHFLALILKWQNCHCEQTTVSFFQLLTSISQNWSHFFKTLHTVYITNMHLGQTVHLTSKTHSKHF